MSLCDHLCVVSGCHWGFKWRCQASQWGNCSSLGWHSQGSLRPTQAAEASARGLRPTALTASLRTRPSLATACSVTCWSQDWGHHLNVTCQISLQLVTRLKGNVPLLTPSTLPSPGTHPTRWLLYASQDLAPPGRHAPALLLLNCWLLHPRHSCLRPLRAKCLTDFPMSVNKAVTRMSWPRL